LPHLENLCAGWHFNHEQSEPRMRPQHDAQEVAVLDILMLALAFGLFAAGIGYAYVCERL
jgi:hypothetical protein